MAAVMVNVVFTPLNAILGFAQSLELNSKEPLTPSQEMATNRILQGGKHLLSLIEDVLDLAKIESGKLELYYNDVQLAEVIKRSCIMLEGQASERHIQLLVPPDARCNYIVHADDTRLSQCLVNLLSNAIKYNHEGGTVTVKVEELEGGRLRISVIDSGVGIPLGKRDELFRPFSRLGYENSGVQGTGIGLSYSKRLIELMGGSIGFESTHDKGSEFWLEVKAMREIDEGEESPLAAATDPKLETVTRGKVVYIEDNPANLQLMEHIVATLDGVEMISAPTAEIGIELTRARRPNLVLLDINLPGMSGVEAVRKMKVSKEIAAIPVVAVSAAAVKQEIDAALEAGMTLNQPRPRENSDKFHLSKCPIEPGHAASR